MNKTEFEALRCPGAILWEDGLVITKHIRAYKPVRILELGAFMGLGTITIIGALKEAGHLFNFTSVDIKAVGKIFNVRDVGQKKRAQLVPIDAPVEHVTGCALAYLKAQPDGIFDMIIEDTTHQTDFTKMLIPQIMRVLRPGGIALFHDLQLPTMQTAFSELDIKPELFPPSWMGRLIKEFG